MYWVDSFLDAGVKTVVEEKPSKTGDLCHRNLVNASKKECERFVRTRLRPEVIFVCDNGTPVRATQEQFDTLARECNWEFKS